jgi:hypothetical protein
MSYCEEPNKLLVSRNGMPHNDGPKVLLCSDGECDCLGWADGTSPSSDAAGERFNEWADNLVRGGMGDGLGQMFGFGSVVKRNEDGDDQLAAQDLAAYDALNDDEDDEIEYGSEDDEFAYEIDDDESEDEAEEDWDFDE